MRLYKVDSEEDFYQRVKGGDAKLAKIVVDAILTHLDSTKKNNYIVTVLFEKEDEYYDLTCNSEQFVFTLNKNLNILIEAEEYELCQKVVEAVKYLENKVGNLEVSH